MHRLPLPLWLRLAAALLISSASSAAVVRMDLLAGIGDFEYSADTTWNVFGHPSYDFDKGSGWVADYRSTVKLLRGVTLRLNGTGTGDRVTIRVATYPDGLESSRVYEFTNGKGATAGMTEVTVSNNTPAGVATALADAVNRTLGSLGSKAFTVSATGDTTYLKPNVNWSVNEVSDSDSANARVVSHVPVWRNGWDRATPDDSVAVGWRRKSAESVHPKDNVLWRIAAGAGIGGSNCQYLAIRNYNGRWGRIELSGIIPVGQGPRAVQPGDSVTFSVDLIRYLDYGALPSGTQVIYTIGIRSGSSVWEKTLTPSPTTVTAEISSGPIPAGATAIDVFLNVAVNGPVGLLRPGLQVDGAHLYVKRAQQANFVTWDVPVQRNRSCTTSKRFEQGDDVYTIAENYDYVTLAEANASLVPLFRYLNPSITLHLYCSSTAVDYRDPRGIDAWYASSPLQMGYLLSSGSTDWLYPNGKGFYVEETLYSHSYYLRYSRPAMRAQWCAVSKDAALRWRFDGVWVDSFSDFIDSRPELGSYNPVREVWEVQDFAHDVFPALHAAGLDTVANVCKRHVYEGSGAAYLDPFFAPDATQADLSPNTPDKVPGASFQEWAFFWFYGSGASAYNAYDGEYWLKCLGDMDAVAAWNTATGARALPESQKKRHDLLVLGKDSATDPAYGVDGWLNFGFASYLLGQNEWTRFGCGVRPTFTAYVDYSITQKLGRPDAPHLPYGGDPLFRYRLYNGSDGSAGGVVVVNGRTDVSKTYTIPFDAVDQSGATWPAGSIITLKPHTGRILVRGQSKLSLTIEIGTLNIASGQVLPVVVNYANKGTGPAENAIVRVPLPKNTAYVPGSAESSGGTYDAASKTVSWSIGRLAAGGSGFRGFQASVL